MTLQQVHHDPELLAALGPATGTLRALDFTDVEQPWMADEVRAIVVQCKSGVAESRTVLMEPVNRNP